MVDPMTDENRRSLIGIAASLVIGALVVLAGSAAGYFTRRAAIRSGADAVDLLLGRRRKPVDDPVIEPLYETPDAAAFVAPAGEAPAPTYLDGGPGLLRRPTPPPRRRSRPRQRGGRS